MFCDHTIELCFLKREFILRCVGASLRKEWTAVKLAKLLFGQSPHHVFHISNMDTIPKGTLKAVSIQQRHEKLKIFFLAVVWRCRHE